MHIPAHTCTYLYCEAVCHLLRRALVAHDTGKPYLGLLYPNATGWVCVDSKRLFLVGLEAEKLRTVSQSWSGCLGICHELPLFQGGCHLCPHLMEDEGLSGVSFLRPLIPFVGQTSPPPRASSWSPSPWTLALQQENSGVTHAFTWLQAQSSNPIF